MTPGAGTRTGTATLTGLAHPGHLSLPFFHKGGGQLDGLTGTCARPLTCLATCTHPTATDTSR